MSTKDESKDVRNCPSCGVENPKNRITCMLCHERMDKKADEGKDAAKGKKGSEKEKDSPKTETKPPFIKNPLVDGKGKPIVVSPTKTDPAPDPTLLTKEPTAPKPKIKRRRRTKVAESIQYFMLEDETLVPVVVQVRIHPIKRKDVDGASASLIDLWNRNKSLISK